jgi:two-component system nitrogen regulation response regulator NtrX
MAANSIFAKSQRMQRVVAQIEEAATSRAGVLITGERGTGRELVARAIHEAGSPGSAPFVAASCAHIAPHNLEHALFGGEAPAARKGNGSTGQDHVAPGSLLYEAIGGTLYFTQICEIPDRVQARLARLLRDGEAVISGRDKTMPLDIRPIAVTSPSCDADVIEGRLREDLIRRFSAVRIDVPPLRERREDVPALVSHFIEKTCRIAGAQPKPVTGPALAVLCALPWRDNVRELQAVVDVLVLRARGDAIELEDVLEQVRLDGALASLPVGLKGTLKEARVHFERDYISAVLEHHFGRIPETAQALGIQRTNLYRKLRTLRLVRPVAPKQARARA